MADLLRIEHLRAGYGEAVVLPDLSLALGEGEVLALLGRNGTGKTTLINSIVGVTRRFGGTIRARRPRHHHAAAGPAGPRRDRLGAAGEKYLPLADGRREHDRGGAAGAVDRRQGLRNVSAIERTQGKFRQSALRRRAADAGDRPRADAQSEIAAARRADRGTGADRGRGAAGGARDHHPGRRGLYHHRRAECPENPSDWPTAP